MTLLDCCSVNISIESNNPEYSVHNSTFQNIIRVLLLFDIRIGSDNGGLSVFSYISLYNVREFLFC